MKKNNSKNINLLFYSGNFDKIHFGLTTASAALAVNIKTKLFFTMDAINSLTKEKDSFGWHDLKSDKASNGKKRNEELLLLGIPGFEELLETCEILQAQFMICETGLLSSGIQSSSLRNDISYYNGGLITFLSDYENNSSTIFL